MNTVVLLTDFGHRDGFAGVLKGVILNINPFANIIDLSHEVEPFNILEGALILKAHYSYFPAGTVFVSVVDPGVGSDRRAIALKCGKYLFVAPDNGILDLVIKDINRPPKAVIIENEKYLLPKRNNTFHGRDIFSPVGAHLSKGIDLEELGRTISYEFKLDFPEPKSSANWIEGEIVYFDRFGNAVTNIPCGEYPYGIFREQRIEYSPYFLKATEGRLSFTCGSFGFMELFIPMDNAKERLNLNVKERVKLYRTKEG